MTNEPVQAEPTKTTFVYDTRTGKVVHVHQFVPYDSKGTCSDHEMETAALELAPAACEREHLAVLHFDGDKYSDRSIRYRVDCEKRVLIEESAVATMMDSICLDPAKLHELRK